jgi:hypothetical protein
MKEGFPVAYKRRVNQAMRHRCSCSKVVQRGDALEATMNGRFPLVELLNVVAIALIVIAMAL